MSKYHPHNQQGPRFLGRTLTLPTCLVPMMHPGAMFPPGKQSILTHLPAWCERKRDSSDLPLDLPLDSVVQFWCSHVLKPVYMEQLELLLNVLLLPSASVSLVASKSLHLILSEHNSCRCLDATTQPSNLYSSALVKVAQTLTLDVEGQKMFTSCWTYP